MYKITRTLLDGTSPSVLTDIPESVKNKFISGPVYGRIKVVDTGEEFTQDNYLKDFKMSDLRFIPDQGIFGGAVAKELKINFVNVDKEFTLQDKEIEAYNSVIDEDNGYIYEIKYGRFIVQHPETEDTTDNTSVTALDYMIKANEPYNDTISYPCTLRQLAENICTQLGITLANESFRNENFSVVDNQFVSGESFRIVIQNIAKSAFSWARIDEDNVLHFDFMKKDTSNIELDVDNYYKLSTDDLLYGPVNRITIANSQIEGEATKIEDVQSITQNGLTEITIYDNYFAYTQEKREQLITAAQGLLGLTYMPVNNMDLTGFCFLNCTDKINVTVLNEGTFDTYLFDHTIDYSGIVKDNIATKALTKTETQYAYTPEMTAALQRTEIIVDKQNQIITSTVENVTEQNNKISQLTQTVDELNAKISDVADVTVHGESNYATVTLPDINASEPILVQIHPINQNISYLYPSTGLFPSSNTYLKIRTLRFTRTYEEDEGGETVTKTQIIDYELPDDLLFYDQDTYDEFYLSYDSQTCQITKRCKYNSDGTVGLLENEIIQTYDYPLIDLGDGDYTITLPGYSFGYLYVRLMASNIYTTQFATKVELSSAIRQTEDEISSNVSRQFGNYYTKTETNSIIGQKADEIELSVSGTYSTKSETATAKDEAINSANSSTDTKLQDYSTTSQVNARLSLKLDKDDNDQVVSMINASADDVTIDADKFNINGVISANGNFQVDTNGNMIATSATLNNALIQSSDNNSSTTIENGNIYTKASDGNKRIEIEGSNIYMYSSTIANDYIGGIRTAYYESNPQRQIIELLCDYGNSIVFSNQTQQQQGTTQYSRMFSLNDDNVGTANFYTNIDMHSKQIKDIADPIIQLYSTDGSNYYWGKPVISYHSDHRYYLYWTGSQLQFYVDGSNVGTLSDKRLKKDIKDIDEDFIKIIDKIEMKQFKVDNRGGLTSFGIIAQDLIDIFEKYNKNPLDYEIVQEIKYRMEDEIFYYTINYEQYLILKTKAQEKKIQLLQEKDKQKDEIITDLIKRIEKLENKEG